MQLNSQFFSGSSVPLRWARSVTVAETSPRQLFGQAAPPSPQRGAGDHGFGRGRHRHHGRARRDPVVEPRGRAVVRLLGARGDGAGNQPASGEGRRRRLGTLSRRPTSTRSCRSRGARWKPTLGGAASACCSSRALRCPPCAATRCRFSRWCSICFATRLMPSSPPNAPVATSRLRARRKLNRGYCLGAPCSRAAGESVRA